MTKCGLFTSGRCCLDASTSAPLSCMGVIPITGRCECHLSAWTLCYLSSRLFIVYWANCHHRAPGGKADELSAAGPGGKALRAENGSEGPGISRNLALQKVGDLLWVGGHLGNYVKLAPAYSESDLGVR